jgi:transposase
MSRIQQLELKIDRFHLAVATKTGFTIRKYVTQGYLSTVCRLMNTIEQDLIAIKLNLNLSISEEHMKKLKELKKFACNN